MSIMDLSSLGVNTLLGTFGNAVLCLAKDPADRVSFQYNPSAIVISHAAPMQQSNGRGKKPESGGSGGLLSSVSSATGVGSGSDTSGQTYDERAKSSGATTIAVRSVTFEGRNTLSDCRKLLKWSHLSEVAGSGSTLTSDLQGLRFTWGSSQSYHVNLNQVTINYTRFSRFGMPVRALVDLSFHEIPDELTPTNPSSGGLSGRSTHLLIGAETLPELATRTYGAPGRWREIAAANGIEDPLRVKPGTYVYLPSAQENDR